MVKAEDARVRNWPGILDLLMVIGLGLFLALLPFHLVIKWLVPGAVGTYWKEILLCLLVLLWLIRCLRERRLVLTRTALDGAILAFVGLLLLRYLLDRNWWDGAWGLYFSVLYLPLIWIVPSLLHRQPRWLQPLLILLVGVGALVAVGGLLEFVLDVPLWPSVEAMQQQGSANIFIYGTQIRRVYFTFDSPTTLANTLAVLLPLALVLILVSRRLVARLAAGLAAALMACCIVLTFSRGIWVATILSLLVMGTAGVFALPSLRGRRLGRKWLPLLLAGGALAVLAAAWGLVVVSQRGQSAPTYQGVVELSSAAYRAAPVTTMSRDLLEEKPARGDATLQSWTLLDPITGQQDSRPVLYEHPFEEGRAEILYSIHVPQDGALRFGIALDPEVWAPEKGDGVSFEIYVAEAGPGQPSKAVFVRYINPKQIPSDRRWRNFLVDLSPWSERTVTLSLIATAGPGGHFAFDWAGWSDLQVVSVTPGTFASAETANPVLRHTRSILDWARDETNRDRLAAWGLALNAWRSNPLWGTGLGTTGAAALRTNPGTAFVTESQVLKALVELGPLGVLVLAYLWFQIARVGLRALRSSDPGSRLLLLGILASLLIVFIEGLVYQNLEVKQVNAYFWALVGTLAFLARQGTSEAQETA
jgi:hypothetical protein